MLTETKQRWAVVVAACIGIGGATALGQCPVSFAPGPAAPAGDGPFALALTDVDRDGNLDALVGNTFSDSITLLMGDGTGAFSPPTNLPVGPGPAALAVGDLNADGWPDAVAANEHSDANDPMVGISVLLGGPGGFAPAVDYGAGRNPRGLAIGDLNGDGILDLAVANRGSADISVLTGHGDGTFTTPASFPTDGGPYDVALADITGDGHVDLVTANLGAGTVAVLAGAGDGSFATPQTHPTGGNPGSLALADLNRDGWLDVVVSHLATDQVAVLLGSGSGPLAAPVAYDAGDGPFDVTVGDWNGDGHPDVAAANSTAGTVSILTGQGDGTLGTPLDLTAGTRPVRVCAGDLNNDGAPDLVTADLVDDNIAVLLHDGPAVAITRHPESQEVFAGAFVQFSVQAAGPGPLHYQWRRNGQPLTNDAVHQGVTTDTLTIAGATDESRGVYDVTVIGACNAPRSAAAFLSVQALPGDVDRDCDVDLSDLAIVLGTFGMTCP